MSSSKATQDQGPSNFKEILDKKAFEARHPNAGKDEEPTLVEKGKSKESDNAVVEHCMLTYATVTETAAEEKKSEPESTPGPPERPHHDVNIEEFVREQHRSKKDQNGQIIDA
ncbi:hypothetical protein PG999_011985 [Apiospora kogelbergensis]|uniref:Uncharacterized protein n=1 Tax=Apiospora kogelbergensis TaxID=1337665 RepID=A0AAW0QH14_9PEZI